MTFNAYLNPAAWEAMPPRPLDLKKAGREVFFVSRQSGMLRALPGLEEISKFESFRRQEVGWRRLPACLCVLLLLLSRAGFRRLSVELQDGFRGTGTGWFSGRHRLQCHFFRSFCCDPPRSGLL